SLGGHGPIMGRGCDTELAGRSHHAGWAVLPGPGGPRSLVPSPRCWGAGISDGGPGTTIPGPARGGRGGGRAGTLATLRARWRAVRLPAPDAGRGRGTSRLRRHGAATDRTTAGRTLRGAGGGSAPPGAVRRDAPPRPRPHHGSRPPGGRRGPRRHRPVGPHGSTATDRDVVEPRPGLARPPRGVAGPAADRSATDRSPTRRQGARR